MCDLTRRGVTRSSHPVECQDAPAVKSCASLQLITPNLEAPGDKIAGLPMQWFPSPTPSLHSSPFPSVAASYIQSRRPEMIELLTANDDSANLPHRLSVINSNCVTSPLTSWPGTDVGRSALRHVDLTGRRHGEACPHLQALPPYCSITLQCVQKAATLMPEQLGEKAVSSWNRKAKKYIKSTINF